MQLNLPSLMLLLGEKSERHKSIYSILLCKYTVCVRKDEIGINIHIYSYWHKGTLDE